MVDRTVEEYLSQRPEVGRWAESLRTECETQKQWDARRSFILRNLEGLGLGSEPGLVPEPGPSLDRLLAMSMVWANHIFMGCRYPQAVMQKALEMAEGVEVTDAPQFTTRDQLKTRTKRSQAQTTDEDGDSSVKQPKSSSSPETVPTQTGPTPAAALPKPRPPARCAAEHQAFFNRLYKAVAWKLVSAGGYGPNLDHFEILRGCVESCKESLACVFVPLKDITGLPVTRSQKEGHVCEIRCRTVYMGTGYGRDEAAARAMASKEALKVFQGRRVQVKTCRRKYEGRDVEDLLLLDETPRSQGFPPALSYPFSTG